MKINDESIYEICRSVNFKRNCDTEPVTCSSMTSWSKSGHGEERERMRTNDDLSHHEQIISKWRGRVPEMGFIIHGTKLYM